MSQEHIDELNEAKNVLDDSSQIYFNGYTILVGLPDIVTLLKKNDDNILLLNTSHTTMKSFCTQMLQLLNEFENDKDCKIKTLADYKK